MANISCQIEVDEKQNVSLYLNTNGHSFDDVELAVKAIIAELNRKLDKKQTCPFYRKQIKKNVSLRRSSKKTQTADY